MAIKIITFFLFLACSGIGFHLAQCNVLENDEIYSQRSNIQNLSYAAILQGKVSEGNNAPLFYISQKTFFTLIHFRLDDDWRAEENICNPNAQMLMRALPVMCMSAVICLIFYFFARHYNIRAGVLALALTLTSPMIWLYWAQARPYGLWLLLTTCQILLFILVLPTHPPTRLWRGRPLFNKEGTSWRWLTVIHFLLCLTTPFGMAQALIATIFLRKKYFWLAFIPAAIGLFYFVHAPRYLFRVPHPAAELITNNFPLDRIILTVACAVLILSHWRRPRLTSQSETAGKLLKYSLALFAITILVIAYYVRMNVHGTLGFELSARYFIFLTPLSIIATMLMWLDAWADNVSNTWMRLHLTQGVAGVLVLGAIRTLVVAQRLLV